LSSKLHAPDIVGKLHKPLYKDKGVLKEKYVDERLSLAQISSQILSSKAAVRDGLKRAGIKIRTPHKNHGRPSQPKYGERKSQGKIIRHLGESRIIRAVLEMRESELSLRQIAKFLDTVGVPTKCRGKKWHPQMVKRIIDVRADNCQTIEPEALMPTYRAIGEMD